MDKTHLREARSDVERDIAMNDPLAAPYAMDSSLDGHLAVDSNLDEHLMDGAEGADVDSDLTPSLERPLFPFVPRTSGLYTFSQLSPLPQLSTVREEVRLDVDGLYPQMVASGTRFALFQPRVHWIANLVSTGVGRWAGTIFYKDGNVGAFPYTNVSIRRTGGLFTGYTLHVSYSGGGSGPTAERSFKFKSSAFRDVNFEFDSVTGTSAVTTMDTQAHPNRPASLPAETLTIDRVFQRAGFAVTRNSDGAVPLAGAGPGARWSDAEMHDAMQVYWSRFANSPQWAMWTLFASLHEQGTSLGGIMFDDIGPNHRQGTAIFEDAFISVAPAGDAAPGAWVQRMRFWTAVHEMGHAFNLAHSWQKALRAPWIPLPNQPEARSFMNYPYNVAGGQTAFFADFAFRFSNDELLFMRHAPSRFVQMGNAEWFDHHGFEEARVSPEPSLKLEVRANRDKAVFEFLEPAMLELKLTNVSDEPQLVERDILSNAEHLTVVVKRSGQDARQWLPYARYCAKESRQVLMPGESLYEPLFAAVGRNGWQIAEPGNYVVQIALHTASEDVVSQPLQLRVLPPRGYEQEVLAQDFFSDEVGRVLNFDGSLHFQGANDVLRDAVERLPEHPVAIHAQVALAGPLLRDYKLLSLPRSDVARRGSLLTGVASSGAQEVTPQQAPTSAQQAGGEFVTNSADLDEALSCLRTVLARPNAEAARTLGHIDHHYYADTLSDALAQHDAQEDAVSVQDTLIATLSERNVPSWVLDEVRDHRDATAKEATRATRHGGHSNGRRSRAR